MNHHSLQAVTAALILCHAAFTFASDKAAVVFPVEGNPTCKTYAKNGLIQELRDSTVTPSETITSDSYNATYYVTNNLKTAGFTANTEIDFAILKSGGIASLIIYPSGGVKSDTNMEVMLEGAAQTIDAITFCYGLGNTPPPEVAAATIPSCNDINNNGGFDGLLVQCPSSPDGGFTAAPRSIIYNLELDKPFYNLKNSPLACVCNNFDANGIPQPLLQCDPNVQYLEVDGVPVQNGACPKPGESKSGAEVTTHIEINNDPYTCYTIGGTRTCYYYAY